MVYDMHSKTKLVSKFEYTKREIASLTKIMVLYVSLKICKKLSINPDTEQISIPREATCLPGTTADLEFKDILSITDLFYALMLPSGNDAGYTLAKHFGNILISNKLEKNSDAEKTTLIDKNSYYTNSKPMVAFIKEMNYYAQKLGMSNTMYDSPHGLANPLNLSTAHDQ